MKWRAFAGKAALLLLQVLLALVLLEGIAQVAVRLMTGRWFPVSARQASPPIYVPDEELDWRLRPGAEAIHRTYDFSVTVAVNSRGFRDSGADYGRARDGQTRILFLGDSFTFGWGVEERERFSSLLAAEAPSLMEGRAVVARNVGVPGYGIPQEGALLERICGDIDPDLVVHEVWPFDWDIMDAENMGCFDGILLSKKALAMNPLLLRIKIFALSNLCLADMAHKLALATALLGRASRMKSGSLTRADLYGGFGLDAYLKGPYPPFEDSARERSLAALEGIARFLRKKGIPLVVLIAPSSFQVYPEDRRQWERLYGVLGETDMERPHAIIRKAASSFGAECLDLLEPIREAAAAGGGRLYFSRDLHWTPAGHLAAARALAKFLQSRPASAGRVR